MPGQELVFENVIDNDQVTMMLQYSGFPAPLFKQNNRFLNRWHNERVERLFKEDIRDLTRVYDISTMLILTDLLPDRVGSVLSINALAKDLYVNFRTASNWLDILEQLFYCFRISPFYSKKIASVRKEKRMYLWDWSQVSNPANRLENMIASHLLKFCDFFVDYHGYKTSLSFIRDNTGREVDFLVCIDNKPWFAVEVKTSDTQISKQLLYFSKKLSIPYSYQVVLNTTEDFISKGIRVMPVAKFLSGLI